MVKSKTNYGLDILLDLDGTTMVVDPLGLYWVKIVVRRVPSSPERPHGLNYSLTLHAADGERLVGFDNAHAVTEKCGASRRAKTAYDHQHRTHITRPYNYSDAETLLVDFWSEVDRILKQRGTTS